MRIYLQLVVLLVFTVSLVSGYYFDDEEVIDDDSTPDYKPLPMTNEFISGDVVVNLHRNMVHRDIQLWSGGVVPYILSPIYPEVVKKRIVKAMREIERQVNTANKTCLKFIPRTNQRQHVYILPISSSCHSKIGRQRGRQQLSIGRGCERIGVIMHELTHALGFWHEQQRPDRDQYIKVMYDNIRPSAKGQFAIIDKSVTLNTSYDYGSIMHYSRTGFAIDHSKPTIVPIQPRGPGVRIGQRNGYSKQDVLKVQRLYKCHEDNERVVETDDLDFCDFSYGSFCLVQQDQKDDFDWEIEEEPAYVVARAANHSGKVARLVLAFNSKDATKICYSYRFLMEGYGSKLVIEVSNDQYWIGRRTYSAHGPSKWGRVYSKTNVKPHTNYTVSFTAHIGNTDVALDDIEIKKGQCD